MTERALLALVMTACSSASKTEPATTQPDQPEKRMANDAPTTGNAIRTFPGITLLPTGNHAIHTHRGPAAKIEHVVLTFEVTDARAHVVEVKRVERLARSCNTDAWQTREPVAIADSELFSWSASDPIAKPSRRITIPAAPPQKYRVRTRFPKPFDAYNACEAFAFDVEVIVDDQQGTYEIPLTVEREEDG